MRKDSLFIFGISLLLTTLIVGCVYYMYTARQSEPGSPEKAGAWKASTQIQAKGNVESIPDVSAETSRRRTDTPIKCQDPELGEFWTNAATCEGTDLQNRISYSAYFASTPAQQDNNGQDFGLLAKQATNSPTEDGNKKPNLRFSGKSPPPGLNISCKFSVGKALEIERDLAVSDDPKESIWRKNYCKWRCEANKDQCPVNDDYFFYRYWDLCVNEYQKIC